MSELKITQKDVYYILFSVYLAMLLIAFSTISYFGAAFEFFHTILTELERRLLLVVMFLLLVIAVFFALEMMDILKKIIEIEKREAIKNGHKKHF